MKAVLRWLGISLATAVMGAGLVSSAYAGSKAATFSGQVSDAMCGAKHAMTGDPVACTRACIGKGSNYALVSGDKVYTLDTTDKEMLSSLDKLAGQQAKVTGQAKGNTIMVKSVEAGN